MFACGRLSAISARFFFNRGGGCYPSRTFRGRRLVPSFRTFSQLKNQIDLDGSFFSLSFVLVQLVTHTKRDSKTSSLFNNRMSAKRICVKISILSSTRGRQKSSTRTLGAPWRKVYRANRF